MSSLAPKSWAIILGGAVALALVAQVTHNLAVTAVLAAVALAAALVERDRSAAQLAEAEKKSDLLVAQRNALGDITTAIAHQQALAKTLKLIGGYAGTLIGGGAARVEPLDDSDHKNGPGRVRAIIMAGGEKWGTLSVDGVTASELPAARLQLLQNFADLAGLAVSHAHTREQLLAESSTDELTGLANQRAFHRELAEEMSRARRHRRPLALILLDLDGFKRINELEGEAGGDLALIEAAKRIRSQLRLEAHVARLGGDEMAVVLPECDADGAYAVSERIRAAVAAAETRAGARMTISSGVAALEPAGETTGTYFGTADDLVRAADGALYGAKRMGGNSTVRFTPKLDQVRPVNPETLRAPRADVTRFA